MDRTARANSNQVSFEEYRSGRLVLPSLRDWLEAGREAKAGHSYPLQKLQSHLPANSTADESVRLPEQEKR
jgi:hypothetical protein